MEAPRGRAISLPSHSQKGRDLTHSPALPLLCHSKARKNLEISFPALSLPFFMMVCAVGRKLFLIVLLATAIIFLSSRKEHNQRDYFDIFPEDAVSRALA